MIENHKFGQKSRSISLASRAHPNDSKLSLLDLAQNITLTPIDRDSNFSKEQWVSGRSHRRSKIGLVPNYKYRNSRNVKIGDHFQSLSLKPNPFSNPLDQNLDTKEFKKDKKYESLIKKIEKYHLDQNEDTSSLPDIQDDYTK